MFSKPLHLTYIHAECNAFILLVSSTYTSRRERQRCYTSTRTSPLSPFLSASPPTHRNSNTRNSVSYHVLHTHVAILRRSKRQGYDAFVLVAMHNCPLILPTSTARTASMFLLSTQTDDADSPFLFAMQEEVPMECIETLVHDSIPWSRGACYGAHGDDGVDLSMRRS